MSLIYISQMCHLPTGSHRKLIYTKWHKNIHTHNEKKKEKKMNDHQ
jgi:hypothetical protein